MDTQNRKYYPLTPSQLAMFLAQQFSLHKQVINIPTSFFVDTLLDLELLKKAAAEAVQRNDAFGIRLTRQDKQKVQYFTDRQVLTLEIIDFSNKSPEVMEAFFRKVGSRALKLYDTPMAKIYIVKAPGGKSGMFSCISHLVMDSWAISMFYKDIMEIYFALQNNTPMPKPPRSAESCLQKDMAYMTSDRHQKDLEFWQKTSY